MPHCCICFASFSSNKGSCSSQERALRWWWQGKTSFQKAGTLSVSRLLVQGGRSSAGTREKGDVGMTESRRAAVQKTRNILWHGIQHLCCYELSAVFTNVFNLLSLCSSIVNLWSKFFQIPQYPHHRGPAAPPFSEWEAAGVLHVIDRKHVVLLCLCLVCWLLSFRQ